MADVCAAEESVRPVFRSSYVLVVSRRERQHAGVRDRAGVDNGTCVDLENVYATSAI